MCVCVCVSSVIVSKRGVTERGTTVVETAPEAATGTTVERKIKTRAKTTTERETGTRTRRGARIEVLVETK